MELIDLGFSEWFQHKHKELGKHSYSLVRVTAVNRDNYLVRNASNEAMAELSGEFMFSAESNLDFPVVGDWAFVQFFNSDTLAIIYDLFPRKTILRRKASGKKIDYQMITANIDVALIVQSCDFDFNLRRLERYLIMAADGNIEPMILLSKSDLVSLKELEQRIYGIKNAKVNCQIISYSSLTGSGLAQIQHSLEPGKTYCLLGSSGVGKTTLLNHLVCQDAFETNLVREKDGKGRHTTARRQLIVLDQGTMLIDTPGMRELGNIDVSTRIDEIFSDINSLAMGCHFNDCTHTSEDGCSVLQAVHDGKLSESRHQSYLKLLKESKHYQMAYAETRKKDRKFGKFIKSTKKQIKQIKQRE
ncbi:ribosome small subunit-dependent GTPase A [Chloroflexota bacterium]